MMTDAALRTGIVVEFNDHVGLGRIDSNGEQFLFHCVEIVDGTRTISVDTEVTFVPVTRFGQREASAVQPVRSTTA
jgi:CspA family cold shock protein